MEKFKNTRFDAAGIGANIVSTADIHDGGLGSTESSLAAYLNLSPDKNW
jgi:hypothetical protein